MFKSKLLDYLTNISLDLVLAFNLDKYYFVQLVCCLDVGGFQVTGRTQKFEALPPSCNCYIIIVKFRLYGSCLLLSHMLHFKDWGSFI